MKTCVNLFAKMRQSLQRLQLRLNITVEKQKLQKSIAVHYYIRISE